MRSKKNTTMSEQFQNKSKNLSFFEEDYVLHSINCDPFKLLFFQVILKINIRTDSNLQDIVIAVGKVEGS